MRYAVKCRNVIFDYYSGGDNYLCNSCHAVSYFPKVKRSAIHHSLSWKGAYTGSDWDAGCVLFKGYKSLKCTSWNSGTHCGGDCGGVTHLEAEQSS